VVPMTSSMRTAGIRTITTGGCLMLLKSRAFTVVVNW
jgi:hypothetical protein